MKNTTAPASRRKPARTPGWCSVCRSSFRSGWGSHASTAKHRKASEQPIPDVLGRMVPNWTRAGWHSTPDRAYGIFDADFVPDPAYAALMTPEQLAEWEQAR